MRGRVHGSGRVSAETGHHIGLARFEDVPHLTGLRFPFRGELQHVEVGAARERHLVDGVEFESGGGHEILLQPDGGADDRHVRVRFDSPDGIGDGEQRVDVSGGAAAGEDDMLHGYRA